MSGGHFDYKQNHIYEMAVEIKRLIEQNDDKTKTEWGEYVYAQLIDCLVLSDDGPDTFLTRLKEELEEMK